MKKDYVLRVGDAYVKRDFFGEYFLSVLDKSSSLIYSFDTEEDAYIAKNTTTNEVIRKQARVYERKISVTLEVCD